jgi:ATP-dependent RNA helicase DDX52/ROK1
MAKFLQSKFLLQTVKSCGYQKPTPVQMQAIPVLCSKRSAIILAETGSGKSMAFALPLLEKIQRGLGLKAVVLAPTRELTIQIYKEFLILSENHLKIAPRVKFLRSSMIPKDEKSLRKLIESCEILIASPLKMASLCELFPTINSVEYLVVDEADKMFEMGFLEQVDKILVNLPN